MSEFRIDQITNQSGSRGPDIAGITTFSATSGMLMPSGDTFKWMIDDNVVKDGLVLYLDAGNDLSYPGSGTLWRDFSGFGNDGTLINGVGYNSSNGGSLSFDGVDDYVSFASNIYNVSILGTVDELTINAWVYWNSFPTNDIDEIVSWWSGGAEIHKDGFLGTSCTSNGGGTNTNPAIRFGDGWLPTGVTFTAATDVQKWWNITAVKTSNNAYIYKNSILSGTKGSSLSWGFNNNLAIGRQHDAGEYIDGKIGVVQLYNRALTPQEIQQNYNALKGRYI